MKEKRDSQLKVLMQRMPSTINLSDKDVPEIKDWDVGEEYTLTLKVKQMSKNIDEDGVRASFEIIKDVGKEKDEMEEDEEYED